MERLSIDEVIEHCNKTCDMTEKIAKARGHELQSIESKQFWEHYQVREWLKELKKYKDAEEQGLLVKIECRCKDCVHWSDSVAGATEHVKLCTVGGYMVGENGYCVYAEQASKQMGE